MLLKFDLSSRKSYKPQFTQENFEIVAIAFKKPPTYTIKDEQEEVIRGKFYEKELNRVVCVWIQLQSSWFPTHLHSSFQRTRSVFFKNFLAGASEVGRILGGSGFRDFLPIIVPRRYRGEINV